MGPLNLQGPLKVVRTPPIYRQVRAPWASGRGLGDLLRTRSPKPELAPRGEEAALNRQYRGAYLGDQGLDDLPGSRKPGRLYCKGCGVKILNTPGPDLTVPGLRSGTSLEVAATRTEARIALPRATNRGGKLLLPPPPYLSLISERSCRDRESSYREVKETLSVRGSP